MDGAEAGEALAVLAEEVANLHDVLVERAAADVGVLAPDRVDEGVAAHDHPGVGLEVEEDAQFLAPDLPAAPAAELDLEPVGMHVRSAEGERAGRELRVARQAAVPCGLGPPKHGAEPRHQLGALEGLAHIVVGPAVERLADDRRAVGRGEDHHRRRRGQLPDARQDLEAVQVGQGEVEQHDRDMLLLDVAEEAGGFVEEMGGETVGAKLVREQGCQAAVILDYGHHGFLLGVHAGLGRGKTAG